MGHIDREGRLWLQLPDALLCTDGQHVIECYALDLEDVLDPHLRQFSAEDRYWCVTSDARLVSVTLDDGSVEDHTAGVPPLHDAYWMWSSRHQDILVGIPGKLIRCNGTQVSVIDAPQDEDGKVHSATIAPDGVLWVSSHLGLHREIDGALTLYDHPDLARVDLWDLVSDDNGGVFVSCDSEPIHFHDGKVARISCKDFELSKTYTTLMIDDEGNIWIGLHFRGAMCANESGAVLFPFEDTPAQVWPKSIVQDHARCFWFIGVGSGILRYDPLRLHVVQRGYMEASVRGADGKLCVTAATKGLLEYDDGHITTLCPNIPARCVGLRRMDNGDVLISSPNGLYVYDASRSTLLRSTEAPGLQGFPGRIAAYSTAIDWENALWVFSPRQLYRFGPNGTEIHDGRELQLASNRTVLFRDSSATLWLLSDADSPVVCYDANGFSRRLERLGDWADDARATCCMEDSDGDIWVGTEFGQVGHYSRATGRIEGVLNLGSEAVVRHLRFDQRGVMWISTELGLTLWDGSRTYRMTEACLLPSRRTVATYTLDDSRHIIVTELGLCEYRSDSSVGPQVFVSRVDADRSYRRPEAAIVTEARSELTIRIGSVNMKPGPLKYEVRLAGHDDWTETWQEEFHYGDLPVGRYRFEARAIDQDLMTNEKPAALDIEVTPDTRELQITELEGELRGAKDFAANIIRSINDAIIVPNTDGLITTTNAAAQQLLGYPGDSLIGTPATRLLPPRHAGLLSASGLESLRTQGPIQSREIELRARDGSVRQVMFSTSCMSDSSGKLQGFVCAAADISEYKALQSVLIRDQKMESLGALASGIAHDFNNLLGVIAGNADLILTEMEGDWKWRDCLADIASACGQAAKLSSEMLAYAGEAQQFREALDLSSIVQQNADLLRSSISRKISVEYDLEQDPPSVWGDEVQLMQIVLNLLINAAEAIGDDAGVISLSTRSGIFNARDLESSFSASPPVSGPYLLLSVQDSGCGMDDQTRQRLFEPFFTTKFSGRGLGLSATQGIVRSHGGVIQVESEPGEGALFRVFLPACEAQPETRPVTEEEFLTAKPETVLVVDDETAILRLTTRMLRHEGITSLTASDGMEGIEKLKQNRDEIDLVLLDMTMPVLDGEETYRRMRELKPDLAVVICTGFSEEKIADHFAADKGLQILFKPFTLAQLREKLAAAMPSRQGSNAEQHQGE